MERIYISGGTPYGLVKSKLTKRPLFRFDEKGRAILDKWALSQLELNGLRQNNFSVSDTPFEDIKPVEEPKPVEDIKPVEEPKPVEEVKPVEEPKPVEEVKPVEEPKVEPIVIPTNRRELIIFAKKLIDEGKIPDMKLNGKTEDIIETIKMEMK
jgi:hypothetical protein